MVVLSASVCTRQGKALVSRQFVEMNRLRVEGLLAAFPKLIGSPHHGSKQHTYVETDSVRYVYQPLENHIYLLLITTKTSNIVEDLGTLRLLAKVVPDVAGMLQESVINEHAFELIFAFDEVLSAGGYKEEVNLSSIRTNLQMESHEEKIHLALKQSKEEQALQAMKDKEREISKQKLTNLRQQLVQGGEGVQMPAGRMEGFGGGGPQATGGGQGGFFDQFDPNQQQQQQQEQQNNQFNSNDPYAHLQQQNQQEVVQPKFIAKKGMKLGGGGGGGLGLGGGGKNNNFMAAMAAEDNLAVKGGAGGAFGLGVQVEKPVAKPSTPLTIELAEKISVLMNREGSVESCEVKGTLTLTSNTDAGTMAMVSVNKSQLPPQFTYQTHPKVDKKTYEQQGNLTLKGGKGFPTGRPVGILRWSYNQHDAAPLSINCWPEDEGDGTINVNIELELTRTDLVLQDVNILLPLGTTDPPVIESIDGIYKHDPNSAMMCWHFDQLDSSNANNSLEFRIAGGNTECFFPVQVGFRSETLLCPIQITNITNIQNGTVIPNQMTKIFSPDSYQIN